MRESPQRADLPIPGRPACSRTLGVVLALVLTTSTAAAGAVTREEALASAFPGASIKAEQVFLTPAQQQEAARASGTDVSSPLVARYLATKNGRPVGTAYVDTHIVRTKKETLLISLDAAGKIKRIDVIVFDEPAEYRAPDSWSRQYAERSLSDDLQVNRAIRPLAGATLTARATNNAVRRMLAIDRVLHRDQPVSR